MTSGVEVQLINDTEEARTAENLLSDVLQPSLQILVDI